jgi:hypothetical protein
MSNVQSKIKVLFYLTNLGIGGTEKTAILFAEHLDRDRFQVFFVYNREGDHTRLPELRRAMSHPDDVLVALHAKPELKALIEKNDIDILHVFRSGFPEFPEPVQDVFVRNFIETNVFGFYDNNTEITKSLFMSEYLMNHSYLQLANAGHPHAGDLLMERFNFVNNPVEDPVTDEAMKLDIPDNTIVLGRVGRPDDGIYTDIAVKASFLLQTQGIPIHWLVVAPPPKMLEDLNRFGLSSTIIDPTVNPKILSRAYNAMDIYAHFRADGETFGVNIAEAMIHGPRS